MPSAIRTRTARATLAALVLFAIHAATAAPVRAQTGPASPARSALPAPVADTGIFSPLPWRPASDVRSASGAPGHRYWQQRADYRIAVTLDTATHRLAGIVTLAYHNQSPDTLRHLWFHLEQNLFRQGSTGSLLFPARSRFGFGDFDGGYTIDSVVQRVAAARPSAPRAAGRRALTPEIDGVLMRVPLAVPLAPGARTEVEVTYAFTVPEHGADRMGRDGALYQLAQWYPRVAVYDDVRGWNTDPYLGQGEFYLEYGDIDYSITLPAGYIVAGTGVLANPEQVLTAEQRRRLALAVRSDTTVAIITADDLRSGAARPSRAGLLTWRFRAANVRDAAWAASPEYLWDASGWEGILTQAYYRPSAAVFWRESARMTRFSIAHYSAWYRYPYPQMSSIEGPVTGMEYPMVAMQDRTDSREALFAVTTHEIGHGWFPMIVGSDERRHAWMDEGFNTFINMSAEEQYFGRDDTGRRRQERGFVMAVDRTPTAQPILTPANRYRGDANLGALAYVKPGLMLQLLRERVLGPAVFDAAFREFIRRWAFRHPQPEDFFRTMEDVSGRDLAWFWRGFFYTTAGLDQAVEEVRNGRDPSGRPTVTVVLKTHGAAVMPVELQLTFEDGSTERRRLPVEIWYGGDTYRYTAPVVRPVRTVRLDPDDELPDAVPQNNAADAAS